MPCLTRICETLYSGSRRSRSELPTTERELRLMAALAQMGEMRIPKKG